MATIDSMNKDTTRLSDGPDWTFDLLDVYLAEIDRVAKLYRLDTYPHQIEVITSVSRKAISISNWRMRNCK